jgi:glycosyltransferase involved in cell wall biosynthesis
MDWAPHEVFSMLPSRAFLEGAQQLADGVRVTVLDGTVPQYRYSVWHAADIFTSLTDNIQETLSQTILEGMACGLPVVASNWDGCRDQVAAAWPA